MTQKGKTGEINVNNVSISSDHNDDLEMTEIETAITENMDDPKDGEPTEEVVATENVADGSISEEFELVGGDLEMNYEDDLDDKDEPENRNEKIKIKRGQNKEYVLVEEFEDKLKFDEYWNEMKLELKLLMLLLPIIIFSGFNLQKVTGLLVLGLWTTTMVLKELMRTSKKPK